MAIIEQPPRPLELAPAGVVGQRQTMGVLRRPVSTAGWRAWLFTVDHKKIGVMYGGAALFFFLVGGIEALLIRLQLAQPNGSILSASTYNQMFTMHATTMIFLFVMPMAAAMANYMMPLQIENGRSKKFVMMRDVTTCCYGAVPNMNDYLVVTMKGEGVEVVQDVPVGLLGTFRIDHRYEGGYVVSLFVMDGEKLLGPKK